MNADDGAKLRENGVEMLDFIADYWMSLEERKPDDCAKPGFFEGKISDEAPNEPEEWSAIMRDIEPVALAGTTHWLSPRFFGYYPMHVSWSSVLAELLSASLGTVGFSWKASPTNTELELRMLNWLGRAIGLPDCFLYGAENSKAGGIIQGSASEATLMAVMSARARAVRKLRLEAEKQKSEESITKETEKSNGIDKLPEPEVFPDHDPALVTRLVAYTSVEGHCSVEKAFMMAGVRMRHIPTTTKNLHENFCIDVAEFEKIVAEDKRRGLVPFILVATFGTTATGATDDISLLGPICEREGIWLHVDSAYAGNYLLLPEYSEWMLRGVEKVDSLSFNCPKQMPINYECSPMWYKDIRESMEHLYVGSEYINGDNTDKVIDYRHLQIPCCRRYRALKLWFVMRTLGVEEIRRRLRKSLEVAAEFAALIIADRRFEFVVPPAFGLTTFRLVGSESTLAEENDANRRLLQRIDADGRALIRPGTANGLYFIRVVMHGRSTAEGARFAYELIDQHARGLLPKPAKSCVREDASASGVPLRAAAPAA